MATLLQIINNVQDLLALPRTSLVVTSTDAATKQLLALSKQVGREIRDECEWGDLQKEYLLTLIAHTTTGDISSGSANITNVADTTGVEIGDVVYANGFSNQGGQSNVVVTAINGSTVTVSQESTASQTTADVVFSRQAYPLPGDFNMHIFRTQWDRTRRWELEGPVSPQEWQFRKSGIIASSVRRRYRVKGLQDNKLFIDYPPTGSDNGSILVFEYFTKSWIKPKTWLSSTSFVANSYCFYNGNYYVTSTGGTTGSTPPTHTSGSVSDGGVTWTYYDDAYEYWTADTDEPNIPSYLLEMGIQWKFLQAKGLEYAALQADYMRQLTLNSAKLTGARDLNMSGRPVEYLVGERNVPDGNWDS